MAANSTPWDVDRLPDASGKTFVVTDGNAGIGYFISEQLASAGATVVLASRSESKAQLAMQAITKNVPHALLDFIPLDLASLESVRSAAEQIGRLGRIDGLILNAASLKQDERRRTADGYEFVFGTNYYGNAQLIAAALPRLAQSAGARIVTMGSVAQRVGRIDLNDLEQDGRPYRGFRTYGTAKQAQMLLALELDRRLRAAGAPVTSIMAHPGGALDGLTPDRAPAFEQTAQQRRAAAFMRPLVQGKDRAAWPAVRAALDTSAQGGQLWSPGSAAGRKPPKSEKLRGALTDLELATGLWENTSRDLGFRWGL